MSLIFYSSIAILILLFGIQIGSRFFKTDRDKLFPVSRAIFFVAVILIFGLLFYYSREQFLLWHRAGPPAAYLIPPYTGIGYFLYYVLMRFWASYFTSFAVALLFLFAAKKLNKKYEERFFYPEEVYLGALAIFLLGHPNWLFYLFLMILSYLVFHFFLPKARVSTYYFWLPTAILVILNSGWLKQFPIWQWLKF